MILIGDLVYYKGLKEIGVVVDILHRVKIYKYKVHFLESNFVWTYDKDELTPIQDA